MADFQRQSNNEEVDVESDLESGVTQAGKALKEKYAKLRTRQKERLSLKKTRIAKFSGAVGLYSLTCAIPVTSSSLKFSSACPSLQAGSFGSLSNNHLWLQKPATAPQWPPTTDLERVFPGIGHHHINNMVAMRPQALPTTSLVTTSRRIFSPSTPTGPILLLGGRFPLPSIRIDQNA
ncbi:hypothetical protein O6P43_001238 [Quillaja saponaria]|uniref:Uncharacterized protein n=1 Tax=Quillaja saponaria TaxID=32244 RepID=A0AAD7QIF9_QUISA|nr:hypothetical protein O6P43_001238 [Quillaja saponaria]